MSLTVVILVFDGGDAAFMRRRAMTAWTYLSQAPTERRFTSMLISTPLMIAGIAVGFPSSAISTRLR